MNVVARNINKDNLTPGKESTVIDTLLSINYPR